MMKKQSRYVLIAVIAVLCIAVFLGIYFLCFYFPEKREMAERERMIREYYDAKLALYRAENDRYADYEVDVAFLGDSLTDGYELEVYYPQYVTANRGIGGETTFGLEERLAVSVYDLKPKVAVMLIGGNNLDTMFENYESILSGLRDHLPKTKIILCSLTAMGGDWARKNQIAAYNNVIIEKLAEQYGFTFVDLYTPMMDAATGEVYADYVLDGAHFTPEGYRVVTSLLTPYLEAAVAAGQ